MVEVSYRRVCFSDDFSRRRLYNDVVVLKVVKVQAVSSLESRRRSR